MKNDYKAPYIDVTYVDKTDIIATSFGTETKITDATDVDWHVRIDINP